ncbi:MAG: hypothetical protein U0Z44_09620 [Kouleothrix sp.]
MQATIRASEKLSYYKPRGLTGRLVLYITPQVLELSPQRLVVDLVVELDLAGLDPRASKRGQRSAEACLSSAYFAATSSPSSWAVYVPLVKFLDRRVDITGQVALFARGCPW